MDADTEFYEACMRGDAATVQMLLDNAGDMGVARRSATDPVYGYAHVPLYLACFGGNREVVSLLIEGGADFSARCARPGSAPITGAAKGLARSSGLNGLGMLDFYSLHQKHHHQ